MVAIIPSSILNKGTRVALPKTMRAAVLTAQGRPLEVDTVELPAALQFGQVLVRVHCSGICGSQLGEIDGVKGPDPYLPHLLGHEGSGVVMETGQGVSTVKEGDAVVLHWMEGSGLASLPPAYTLRGAKLNAGFVTTFNEYAVVSENRVTVIPQGFDMATAALFGCAVTTGFGVINNKAKVGIGSSVVIFGAGGVGLSMIQGAALAGAYPIVALDMFDNRLELASSLGASHVVNVSTPGFEAELRKVVGPGGADVCIDNTGKPEVIRLAYDLTAKNGKTILVGVPAKGHEATLFTLPLHFGKELTGTKGGECAPHLDIPKYVRLCGVGKLDLGRLVTERYALEDINTAIERMRNGQLAGRCLIELCKE